MVGTARFALDDPDLGTAPTTPVRTGRPASNETGSQQQAADEAGIVPPPPWLPYAPDPGTYTQLWLSESTGTSAADMATECEMYLDAFKGTPVDYNDIITSLLATSKGMIFLTVLTGNQVCPVHSLGRYSCGLGMHTPAHNRIFGLLGEKIGESLPPVVMVPAAGLAPWLQIENHNLPTTGDLAGLETSRSRTVSEPDGGDEDDDDRPKVSVQKLVMIPGPGRPTSWHPSPLGKPYKRTRLSCRPSQYPSKILSTSSRPGSAWPALTMTRAKNWY
jgi:hypothetical protein